MELHTRTSMNELPTYPFPLCPLYNEHQASFVYSSSSSSVFTTSSLKGPHEKLNSGRPILE